MTARPPPAPFAPAPFAPNDLEPGQWVRHPDRPDWGPGQVQSAIGHRVTVMFEDAGKVLVDTSVVKLRLLRAPDQP